MSEYLAVGVVIAFIVFGGIPTVRRYLKEIKTEASDRAVKGDRTKSDEAG